MTNEQILAQITSASVVLEGLIEKGTRLLEQYDNVAKRVDDLSALVTETTMIADKTGDSAKECVWVLRDCEAILAEIKELTGKTEQ